MTLKYSILQYIIYKWLFPRKKIFDHSEKLNKNLQQTECKKRKKKKRKKKKRKQSFRSAFLYIFFLKGSSVNAFMAHSKRYFLEHSA